MGCHKFCLCSTCSSVFFAQSSCLSILDPPSFQSKHWLSKLTFGEALWHGWILRTCSPSSMLAIVLLGALLSNSGNDKLHLLPWTSMCWLLMGFSKGDSWHSGWAHCLCSLLCSTPSALLPEEIDPDHSQFSSVQSLIRVRFFATPWIAARQASLSITNSRSSLRLTSIESVMPSSHLILCRPLFLLPPAPNPSQHQSLFQWVNSSHEVAKVLEFQL